MTQKNKKKRHRYWRRTASSRRRGDFDKVLDDATRRLRSTNPSAARIIADYRRYSRLPHASERLLLHRHRVERGREAIDDLILSFVAIPVRALAKQEHLDQSLDDLVQEAIADMIVYLEGVEIGSRSQWTTLVSLIPRNARNGYAIRMATQTKLPRDRMMSKTLARLSDLPREDLELLDEGDLVRMFPRTDGDLVAEAVAGLTSEVSRAAPEESFDPTAGMDRAVDLGRIINWGRENLSEREWTIFSMRYLGDVESSFEDIGTVLGVTAERVRQVERDLIKKLGEAYACDLDP